MSIMRTTLSIDDELLARARERARERGITLGAVVENALRRDFASEVRTDAPTLPVFTKGSGPKPGIDLTSNRVLHEVLDEDLPLDRLR